MISIAQTCSISPFPGRGIYNPYLSSSSPDAGKNDDTSRSAIPASLSTHHKQLRVILADDDQDDRELFAEAMLETGTPVKLEFAEDGSRLIEILMSSTKPLPDLIFMDLNMPNKSGTECLAEIRSNERLKHLTIIIYSTSSSQKDIEDTFQRGANLYIRKPSNYHDLLNITRRVLSLDWDNHQPRKSRNSFVLSPKTQ